MEKKKLCGLFVLLLLVLASHETEARLCESKSHKFHGACMSDHNCGMVCKNEGFTGGICQGLRKRCFCTREC